MKAENMSLQEIINELWSPLQCLSNCKSNDEIDTILKSMFTGSSGSIVIEHIIPATVNLLLRLLEILQSLQNNNSATPLLSVQHLRIIYSAIEILWHWGINCEVKRRAGFAMPSQSLPNSLLISKLVIDYITTCTADTIPRSTEQLWSVVDCLSQVVLSPNFSGLMLQRNLDRLLLSYLVLERDSSDDTISLRAASALRTLYEGPTASVVVTKLRGFTKGPVWLRDACCGILNSVLQGTGGLEAVLSGYLEGSLDSSFAEALQVHVAKLVTTPPAGAETAPFLSNIAEQTLDLLLFGLFKNDKTLLRVCALIVTRIAMISPALCDEKLMGVLAAPLLLCLASNQQPASDRSNVYRRYLEQHEQSAAGPVVVVAIHDQAVLADERSVQSCIEMLHVLLTICPTHRALMESIVRVKIDRAVLRLHAYLLTAEQNCVKSVSVWNTSASAQLLHTVEEICLSYFQYRGTKALSLLEQLALGDLAAHKGSLSGQTPCFQLTLSGMVEVRITPTVQGLAVGAADDVLNVHQLLQARSSSSDQATASVTKVATAFIERNVEAVALIINKLEERYSVRLAALKERAERNHSEGKSSSTGSSTNAAAEGGYEYLGSELFLRCLHGFLRIPDLPSGAAEDSEVSPLQWGVAMLKLQEGLPFTVLLRDGLQILKLLKAFVEHYAAAPPVTNVVPSDGNPIGATDSGSLEDNVVTTAVKKRPLIVELDSSSTAVESIAQQAGPSQEDSDRQGLLECALELLAGILGLGEAKRAPEEEQLIRDLVEPLQVIAFWEDIEEETAPNSESGVAAKARDVALLILSRSYNQTHLCAPPSSSGQGGGGTGESFPQLLGRMRSADFLYADSPALRGYAMSLLLTHLRTRRTGLSKVQWLSEEDAQLGLSALLPLLVDQESFVYLSALQVLRELAQHQPAPVFAALVSSFAADETLQHNLISLSFPVLPQSRRAMVGEALVLVLGQARRAKHERPAFHIQIVQQLPALVNACLKIARQRSSAAGAEAVNQNVDLSKMRITDETVNSPAQSAFTNTQLSAASPQSGMTESEATTLRAAAEAADEVILRQSAVSLLAEAVQTAGGAAHRFLDDVLDVAVGVLSMESTYTQSTRAARRSAAYLASVATAELLKGASASQLLQNASGSGATSRKSRSMDSFQSTYEVLQRVALSDPDAVAAYHAGQGLCALQEIYEAIYRKAFSSADLPDIDSRKATYEKFNIDLKL